MSTPPSSAGKPAPAGLVEWGQWNLCVGAFGSPGSGKSEWALRAVVELARRRPCYVIAHDNGFRLRERFHDGVPTGVIRHGSVDAARQALRKDPRGVHAIATEDAAPVLAFAKEVGEQSLAVHGHINGRPKRGVPVICYIDEAVSAADASPQRLGQQLRQAVTLRRHWHVGLVYTCQSPWLLHYSMLTNSTQLALFRLPSQRDHRRLLEGGVPPADVARIQALKQYERVIVTMDPSATQVPLFS